MSANVRYLSAPLSFPFPTAPPATGPRNKEIKNEVEINGMKHCHLRDGAALIQFLAWLEEELENGNTSLTEVSVSDKLEEFRGQQEDFFSLSFPTIAGSGPNGAIIHYRPQKETCASVEKSKMFLCDSGGQYRDGTTDVTRTVHFGTPTSHEKECYTRVLMGHIALGSAVFPKDATSGKELDTLARMPLWRAGLDYGHGTGHGVGSFLNVHEGPQGISMRFVATMPPFAAGMTITNEPGYYEKGNFGIRIENVMIVAAETTKFNDGNYLHLKPLTMVPYDTKLIDVTIMSDFDVDYVNEYHRQCLAKVGPLLQHNEKALHWLKKATQPISKHLE